MERVGVSLCVREVCESGESLSRTVLYSHIVQLIDITLSLVYMFVCIYIAN